MPETIANKVSPAALADRQAVQAWCRLHPDQPEPERTEVVKLKHKTAVYRLWSAGREGEAVVAKRCHAGTGEVERLVYERVLPSSGVTALRYFGWVPEPAGEFCWLFLEDAGAEAYSPSREDHRALAGRWLGALHCLTLGKELRDALPDRSPSHYLKQIAASRAALQECVDNPVLAPHEAELLKSMVAGCDLMQARWDELESYLQYWPCAIVHGDFVAKNLRLRRGPSGAQLLVFDWEMAGWGVPAVDLAQCLGRAASPDLEAYCATRGRPLRDLPPGGLRRLAEYGNLLRLVDKIFWEALGIGGDSYEFLARPLTALRSYEPELAAALRAVNWNAHD